MDNVVSIRSLLGAPVRLGNLTIGVVCDVFLARNLGHAFGVSVVGDDGREWFVPWIGVTLEHGRVRVSSALLVFAPGSEVCNRHGTSALDLLSGSERIGELFLSGDGGVATVVRTYDGASEARHPQPVLVTLTEKPKPSAAYAA